jgi:RNA polymerase sigma-70 factor, ECF subfamily
MVDAGQTVRAIDPDFEAFYRRELRPMIALGISLAADREAGVDLAQEALLRAYRSWPMVQTMDKPGAWVRRVLVNLAIDRRRRRDRERRALARLTPPDPVVQPDPVSDRFWTLVRELPDTQRAVVALFYLEDLPVDEIAGVLQISDGTVKSALFRARKSLAAAMQAEVVR